MSPCRHIVLKILIVAATCWFVSAPAESRLEIRGYYKNFSVAYRLPAVSYLDVQNKPYWIGSSSNRFRFDAKAKLRQNISLDLSYDFAPRIQDRRLFRREALSFDLNPESYRVDDLDRWLFPDEDDITNLAIFQNLDRAFVTVALPRADIFLGRQPIAWGSARLINPTDIIAPYAYTELDTEDRIGVDALRVRIPLGFMGELDAGYVAGKDFKYENSAIYVRSRYSLFQTDLSAMAVGFRQNLLLGLDMARAIGDAGFWMESGYVLVDALTTNGQSPDNNYLRFSTGFDYSPGMNSYFFIEYHFNQAGSCHPEKYAGLTGSTAYREGAVYLLGRHYLIPGLSCQISALILGSMEMLVNLGDLSLSLTPNIEYNIAPDIYLAAGAYLGLGRSTQLTGNDTVPVIDLRSEFGSYPDFFYSSFRIYF